MQSHGLIRQDAPLANQINLFETTYISWYTE
jgi:hypothetical protein